MKILYAAFLVLLFWITSHPWLHSEGDSDLFWSASCVLIEQAEFPNFKNTFCASQNQELRNEGVKILKTYPVWSHWIFSWQAHYSAQTADLLNKTLIFVSFFFIFFVLIDINFGNAALSKEYLILSAFILSYFPLYYLIKSSQNSWLILSCFSIFLKFSVLPRKNNIFDLSKDFLSGIFLGLTFIKPHILYLVYPVVIYSQYKLKKPALIFGLILTFVSLLTLSDYSKLTESYWYQGLFSLSEQSLNHIFHNAQPTLSGLIGIQSKGLRFFSFGLAFILIIPYLHKLQVGCDTTLVTLIIPLSLLTTPYVVAYDFILLLPAFFLIFASREIASFYKYILLITCLITSSIIFYTQNQMYGVIYPVVVLLFSVKPIVGQSRLKPSTQQRPSDLCNSLLNLRIRD